MWNSESGGDSGGLKPPFAVPGPIRNAVGGVLPPCRPADSRLLALGQLELDSPILS